MSIFQSHAGSNLVNREDRTMTTLAVVGAAVVAALAIFVLAAAAVGVPVAPQSQSVPSVDGP